MNLWSGLYGPAIDLWSCLYSIAKQVKKNFDFQVITIKLLRASYRPLVLSLTRNMATQAWDFVYFLSTQHLEFQNTNQSDSETNQGTDIQTWLWPTFQIFV